MELEIVVRTLKGTEANLGVLSVDETKTRQQIVEECALWALEKAETWLETETWEENEEAHRRSVRYPERVNLIVMAIGQSALKAERSGNCKSCGGLNLASAVFRYLAKNGLKRK